MDDTLQKSTFWGNDGIFSTLFSGKKRTINSSLIDEFVKFSKEFNNSSKSVQVLKEELGGLSPEIEKYAKTQKNGKLTLEGFTNSLNQSTLAAKSSQIAMKGLTTVGNALIGIGIGLVASNIVNFLFELANANTELLETAKELSNEFQETQASISDYKEKISDLHSIINNSSSSISDVTKARQELMEIQDELIQKYGDEKESIDIVTDAINNQADALDNLAEKQYQQWKNEFNKKTTGQSVLDFISSDNISNAFFKLTDFDFSGAWDMLTRPTQSNIDKMVDSMQYAYFELEKTGDQTFDELIKRTYDLQSNYNDTKFVISGYLGDVYQDLLEIQSLSEKFQTTDRFESDITRIANIVNDTLEAYEDSYNAYVLYDQIGNSDNVKYKEQLDAIQKAKDLYDEVLTSGNNAETQKAFNNFASMLSSTIDSAFSNGDYDIGNYFKSLYPELQSEISSWKFDLDFAVDENGIRQQITDSLKVLDGYSIEDIDGFNVLTASQEEIDAYASLTNAANQYDLSIDQLLSSLESLGLIISDNYQQLSDKYGVDNVSTLSSDDLEIAYEISDDTIKTWDELLSKIKEYKGESSGIADTAATISSSISQIATQLKPQFDELAEAYKEIFSEDGFSIDVVDNEMLENLRSAFEDIEEDVGVSFDTTELNKFFSVLTDGASTADEVQQAFNDLATAYLYSTDTMENLNDETAQAIEQQLQEMGVTNANEVVSAALAQQKLNLGVANLYAAQTGGTLATATAEEIVNFAAEQIEMGNLSQEMAQLLLQKASFNLSTINTEADINNLIALAETAGATAQTLNVLNAAKGRFGSTNSDSLDALRARKDLALGINNAPELNFDYEPVKLDFNGAYAGSKDAAGKAGKEAADEYKKKFEEELDDLQSLHDRGKITEKEYLDALRANYITLYYSNVIHKK